MSADPKGSPGNTPKRSHFLFILMIAAVARLGAFLYISHLRHLGAITFWGNEDIAIALSLYQHHSYASPFGIPSGPTALLAPGYPLLIAAAMYLLGSGPAATTAMIAFQTVLSLLTLALLMFIARRHFGVRTANLAGFVFAVWLPMVIAPTYIWDTCLSALMLTAAVGLAPVLKWSRLQAVAVGLGSAIAILVNPSLLIILFALFAWSAWRARVFPWVGLVVFVAALSPWTIRNLVVMRSFVPLRSSFGYELWLGNHSGGDGNMKAAPFPENDLKDRLLLQRMGEIGYVHAKQASAMAFIAAHPAEFARLSGKRFFRFWTGTANSASPITAYVALLGFAGLSLLWRRKQLALLFSLPLVIYPLPYYITHADARFQFVIDPLLAVLAGYACECLLAFIARRPLPVPAISPEMPADQPSA